MIGSVTGVELGFTPTLEERVLLTLLLVVGFALAVVAGRRLTAAIRDRWDSRLVNVTVAFAMLGLLGGVAFTLVTVWDASPTVRRVVQQFGDPVRLATLTAISVVLLAAVYVMTGFIRRALQEFAEGRDAVSPHQAEVSYRVVQVALYLLVLVVLFGLWQVNLGGLLIGAGFAGIVLGMAARQTLGALIAGFVLMFSRPFELGDWVKIGDKEGIVTDITVVNTRIETFDGEYVILPNDVVSGNDIVNRSRKGRLRLHVEVGVDYDTDVEHAADVARETMKDVDEILTVPQPRVVLREFGGSAVVLGLRFWIDNPSARRKWRAQTAVIGAVKSAFDEEGITIPFPQRTVSGRDGEPLGVDGVEVGEAGGDDD